MNNKLLSLIILIFPFLCSSQIIGEVKDDNNFAIEYATISIFNIQDSTLVSGNITNQNGEYEIDLPTLGSYYLKCSFVGFQSTVISNILISKNSKKIDLPTIVLFKGAHGLFRMFAWWF